MSHRNSASEHRTIFFSGHTMNSSPYYLLQYIQYSQTEQRCKHRNSDLMPCELFWKGSIALTPPALPHPPKSGQSGESTLAKLLCAQRLHRPAEFIPAATALRHTIYHFLLSLPYQGMGQLQDTQVRKPKSFN